MSSDIPYHLPLYALFIFLRLRGSFLRRGRREREREYCLRGWGARFLLRLFDLSNWPRSSLEGVLSLGSSARFCHHPLGGTHLDPVPLSTENLVSLLLFAFFTLQEVIYYALFWQCRRVFARCVRKFVPVYVSAYACLYIRRPVLALYDHPVSVIFKVLLSAPRLPSPPTDSPWPPPYEFFS